jgi:tetratricopeptide (TPR) repeat protein
MEAAPAPAPPRPEPAPAADGAEAARIASQYEIQLRQTLLRDAEPPRSFARRHWLAILSVSLAVVVLGGGGITYRLVRHRNRAAEVKQDVASARKGLARDTVGALREAAKVLEEARELDPENREALSLSAQVAALLASDHGDEAARDLALKLAATGQAGEGGLAARYILAATSTERAVYAEPIVTAPGAAGPLLQTLAGEALLLRGDADGAARRLEAAARATPPMLRALADLGDLYREQGRAEEALPYYQAALSAHPTHPRAAVGAAEVRLALGRDPADSLRELRAVEADPQSAPRPRDRLRFELTLAKVLAAGGDRAAAADRLDRVTARLGPRAEVAAALAEIHLAAGAFGDAEAEAQRAVRLAPKEVGYRILLARAEDGRGHWREMLRATEGQQARELRLWRGIALYQLGDFRRAEAELQRTARDGKMPAEAAAWYALAELGLGREAQARAVLDKLVSLKSPPSVAFVAAGKVELAGGRMEAAERHFRSAVDRNPSSLEGHCALGRLLLARGRAKDAAPFLERAAKLNPFHAEARLALGNARLDAGDGRGARDEYGGVLEVEPRSGEALRGLAAAWLAEQKPREARRAAERATSADPRNPRSWLSAARAALADGDDRAARRHAERALKLAPRGETAAEARKIVQDAKRRR